MLKLLLKPAEVARELLDLRAVVPVFLDKGQSAKSADREDFEAMLDFVRARGDIDYVILEEIDRFARSRRDDANLSYELERIGVELISVQETSTARPAASCCTPSWPGSPSTVATTCCAK